MKLADIDTVSSIPAVLGAQQSALDLANIDESKSRADGEAQGAINEAKDYGTQMSDNFNKQLVSVCFYSDICELMRDLIHVLVSFQS